MNRDTLRQIMQWRERTYGYVSLTPREYEAVTIERAIRAREGGVSRLRLEYLNGKLPSAWWRTDHPTVESARQAVEEELTSISRAEWGIQTKVAEEMEISRQAVHELLERASIVMAYFAECEPDAGYGWRFDEEDGVWWLAVPVAPIDARTRRKLVR